MSSDRSRRSRRRKLAAHDRGSDRHHPTANYLAKLARKHAERSAIRRHPKVVED